MKVTIALCFLMWSALGLAQTNVGQEFWTQMEIYSGRDKKVFKTFDIHSYVNGTTTEIRESTYGKMYFEGSHIMLEMPEGLMVANGPLALQIAHQNKTIILTRSIMSDQDLQAQLNFVTIIKQLRDKGKLKIEGTANAYVVSTTEDNIGNFRKLSWHFRRGGTFDILKTVIHFNSVELTDNTSSGGSGDTYKLDSPRLEIVYKDSKTITPIMVKDVVIEKDGKYILTEKYSGYSLIDMTNRDEILYSH